MTTPTLRALGDAGLRQRLHSPRGLRLRVGPYCYAINSTVPVVARALATLYCDFRIEPDDRFADFHVRIGAEGWARRWRRHAVFSFDDIRPFGSIPLDQSHAFLEWGMNWCLSVTMHEHLKLHAAVVARGDCAVVMPGLPGAGKSTLCAALAVRGWRVLSDEHALIVPGTQQITPVNRPVSLKNESIRLIGDYEPTAVIGPVSNDTHMGRVAHLKADIAPGSHDIAPVTARYMVFPRYRAGRALHLQARSRAESFIFAAHHSFNYSLLGERGFEAMAVYVDAVECLDLVYSDLDSAVSLFERLHNGSPGA